MDKSEYTEAFGRFLKHKRLSMNWSQTDLASKMGNNSQNISRIERGELTPTIYWVDKLAKVFSCKTSEFFEEYEKYSMNNNH